VLSLVKSNPDGDVGFMANQRLMNVAITRARKGMVIIGNPSTFMQHGIWLRLLQDYNSDHLIKKLQLGATSWSLTTTRLALIRRPARPITEIRSMRLYSCDYD